MYTLLRMVEVAIHVDDAIDTNNMSTTGEIKSGVAT